MSGIEGKDQAVRGIAPTLPLPPGTDAQIGELGLALARALVPGAARGPEELARTLFELGRLPVAAQSVVLAALAKGHPEANPVEAVRARIAEAFPPGSERRHRLAEQLALRNGLDPARLSRTALESVITQALAKIAPIKPTPRPAIEDVLEPSPSFGPFVAPPDTPAASAAAQAVATAPPPLPPPVAPYFQPAPAQVAEPPAPAPPPPPVWVPPPAGKKKKGLFGKIAGFFKSLFKLAIGYDIVKKVWNKVKKYVKQLLPYIAMILRIIPLGWTQILATVIQIYLAAKAKNIMGIVSAVVSFIPAVGAYLSSVGLNTAAQVLTRVAEVAKYASQAMDAYSKIKKGDWLGGLAGIAGAAAGVVGNISEDAASTLKDWSKNLDTWGDRLASGMQAIKAAKRGDFLGAFGVGANLAADLDLLPTDDDGTFKKVAGAAKQVGAIQTALRSGNWTDAADALVGLADKIDEPELKTVAGTVQKLVTVQQMVKKKDYLGAAAIVLRVVGQLPQQSVETKASLQQMAGRLQAAGQAMARGRSGDFEGAAKELWKLGLSIEWDKDTREGLQKAAKTFTGALAVHDAIKSGDLATATKLLGDVTALYSEEAATPEALRKLARRLQDSQDLQEAIRKGDHSKASDILGKILERETTGGDARSGGGGQDTQGGSGEGAESGQGDSRATLVASDSGTNDVHASAAAPRSLDSAVEEVIQLLNVWTRTPDGGRILEIIRSLPEWEINPLLTELKVRGYLQKLFDGVKGEEHQELVRLLTTMGDRAVLDESGPGMLLAGYTVPVGPVDPKKVAREITPEVASQLGLPWPLDSQNLTPEQVVTLEEVGQDKSFLESLKDKADGWTLSDIGHTGLDILGIVPGVGEAADVANAVWYAAEGNYLDAGLSLISVIPIVGDVIGKGGKLATRLGGAAAKKKVLDALEGVDVVKFLDQFKTHPKLGPYVAKMQEAVRKWIDELKASQGGMDVKLPAGAIRDLRSITAAAANAPFVAKGWSPPYAAGTTVRTFTTSTEIKLVRVHGAGNRPGQFLVRADEIRGMTPLEIQRHLGLPRTPTHISDVRVPAGTSMQMGRVAPQPTFGAPDAGGVQYQLLEDIPLSAFTNTRPL